MPARTTAIWAATASFRVLGGLRPGIRAVGRPERRNVTRVPGASSAGGSTDGSNNSMSVCPSRCQPPGEAVGYTAVYGPAIATEPAGTEVRGVTRRGSRSVGSSPDRYAKPGANPQKSATYVPATCRAITSSTANPNSAATASRSSPSYTTSMTNGRPDPSADPPTVTSRPAIQSATDPIASRPVTTTSTVSAAGTTSTTSGRLVRTEARSAGRTPSIGVTSSALPP